MGSSGVDPDNCDGADLLSFEDEVKTIALTRKMLYTYVLLSEHPCKRDSANPNMAIVPDPQNLISYTE